MPLTMEQLRVRPMDVLMGRTRYDKMRYAAIGFGGAFIALLVIVLAMAGAMAFAARAAGAEFQWGFFIPNKVTWCQGLTPTPEPTIAASTAAYRLPSPTEGGVGAALYMSSDRGREAVGRPSLPDVGHPAGPPSPSSAYLTLWMLWSILDGLGAALLFLLGVWFGRRGHGSR